MHGATSGDGSVGADDERLTETLRDAQRLGFFGAAPIEQAIIHARGFVEALPLRPGLRIVDIGAGGGLPGLVIASARPDAQVTLVDRREKRTDFLRRAVRRLGYDHVEVVTADVEMLAREVSAGAVEPFDAVTARGFGPPEATLRLARRLVGTVSVIIISEPPDGDRWDEQLLSELGLTSERIGPVRRFTAVVAP